MEGILKWRILEKLSLLFHFYNISAVDFATKKILKNNFQDIMKDEMVYGLWFIISKIEMILRDYK